MRAPRVRPAPSSPHRRPTPIWWCPACASRPCEMKRPQSPARGLGFFGPPRGTDTVSEARSGAYSATVGTKPGGGREPERDGRRTGVRSTGRRPPTSARHDASRSRVHAPVTEERSVTPASGAVPRRRVALRVRCRAQRSSTTVASGPSGHLRFPAPGSVPREDSPPAVRDPVARLVSVLMARHGKCDVRRSAILVRAGPSSDCKPLLCSFCAR